MVESMECVNKDACIEEKDAFGISMDGKTRGTTDIKY